MKFIEEYCVNDVKYGIEHRANRREDGEYQLWAGGGAIGAFPALTEARAVLNRYITAKLEREILEGRKKLRRMVAIREALDPDEPLMLQGFRVEHVAK